MVAMVTHLVNIKCSQNLTPGSIIDGLFLYSMNKVDVPPPQLIVDV